MQKYRQVGEKATEWTLQIDKNSRGGPAMQGAFKKYQEKQLGQVSSASKQIEEIWRDINT